MSILDLLHVAGDVLFEEPGHHHHHYQRDAAPRALSGSSNLELTERLMALEARVAAQAAALQRTQFAFDALCDMLSDQGLLEADVIRYRVEARLEELAADAAAAAERRRAELDKLSGPAERERPEEPGLTAPTRCALCGATVPLHRTSITEDGNVCDQCMARP